MLIAFEGLDGSGKTTQVRLLAKALEAKGYKVLLVEEPGTTAVGRQIREILLKRGNEISPLAELLLYEASRAQLVQETLKPALAAGKVVIADRYALSSLAYQGYGRGLPLELVEELNKVATGGLEPEVTFLLDVPPEVGLRRKGQDRDKDRLEEATLEFHRRVREGYLELARKDGRIYLLDGRRPPEELHREVAEILQRIGLDL